MQFKESKATDLTEKIMSKLSPLNDNAILKLDPSDYNRLYSHTYKVLTEAFESAIESNKAFVTACSTLDASLIEEIKAIEAEGNKKIIVIGGPTTQEKPDLTMGSMTLEVIPRLQDNELYIPKTKRTNHERQPASFGKGKNKRRK